MRALHRWPLWSLGVSCALSQVTEPDVVPARAAEVRRTALTGKGPRIIAPAGFRPRVLAEEANVEELEGESPEADGDSDEQDQDREGSETDEAREGERLDEDEAEEDGAEDEAEEEEGEECELDRNGVCEEEFHSNDRQVASMMLGGVSFVMGVLYFVNWKDEDIRRYTWKIVSTTISIFLAVLLFQGFNVVILAVLERLGIGEDRPEIISIAQYFHCYFYIFCLQITLGWYSGVFRPDTPMGLDEKEWVISDIYSIDFNFPVDEVRVSGKTNKTDAEAPQKGAAGAPARGMYVDDNGRDILVRQRVKKEENILQINSWGRLWAHMAGFAAINAGATAQQQGIFKVNPLMSMVPVLINSCIVWASFALFGTVRSKLSSRTPHANRMHLMEEAAFEAENDISSLSISFLSVQCIRFALTNVLPNEEGLDSHLDRQNLPYAIIGIYLIGIGFAAFAVMLVSFQANNKDLQGQLPPPTQSPLPSDRSGDDATRQLMQSDATGNPSGDPGSPDQSSLQPDGMEEPPKTLLGRVLMVGLNATAMCFAWCVLWGTRWLFEIIPLPIFEEHTIMGRVVMALLLSGAGASAVFVLDIVDDAHNGVEDSKAGAQAIQMLVNALGILIGFSWEHCFDGSVGAMASKAGQWGVAVKFWLGVLIWIVVMPVWRRHVLTKEIIYQKMKEEKELRKAVLRKEFENNKKKMSTRSGGSSPT